MKIKTREHFQWLKQQARFKNSVTITRMLTYLPKTYKNKPLHSIPYLFVQLPIAPTPQPTSPLLLIIPSYSAQPLLNPLNLINHQAHKNRPGTNSANRHLPNTITPQNIQTKVHIHSKYNRTPATVNKAIAQKLPLYFPSKSSRSLTFIS